MTPKQRRKNKIVGLIFLVFVIAVFVWVIGRQLFGGQLG